MPSQNPLWPSPVPAAPSLNLGQQPQGLGLGGASPYQMPQVPWSQNPFITTAALGLLGGRTLNEGLQNVAQNAPAGLAAKTAMQRDIQGQQENAQKRAAMNAVIKWKSGVPLTPQEQAAIEAAPEVKLQFGMPEKPNYMAVGKRVFNETTGQWVDLPGGEEPDAATIANEIAVRKEYHGRPGVERYETAQPILASMAQSVSNPSAMADFDFIYGMAKIYDPSSAVKEGEMGMVIDSQSIPAQIKGTLEKLLNGEAVLQPQLRRDLVNAARTRVGEYRKQAEREGETYTKIATGMGTDPLKIVSPLAPLPELPAVDPNSPDPLGIGGM